MFAVGEFWRPDIGAIDHFLDREQYKVKSVMVWKYKQSASGRDKERN